ncbi:coenzyme A transporter [Coemansia spiralis]|uniref:Coenzyme A transporter n=2 Tax=Coemansia TaxID=4863 RepID=A0A9W8GA45_9FUNG|nr:coenzyme A transporter [Coemansia umbellata]KAJ2622766.1 coenzyme A transporter [Coemansia sp. RSA 1358]KAJ2679022.1 coenzyme A transporter [Coemansia spiralis]
MHRSVTPATTVSRSSQDEETQTAKIDAVAAQQHKDSLNLATSVNTELPLELLSNSKAAATLPENQSSANTRYAAKTLLIGGIAGCTAKTVVAPLDRVKILFQTHNTRYARYAGTHFGLFKAGAAIYREYGIRGLFQGHSMQLARIFPYAAIKYMSYEQLKLILGRRISDQHLRNFLAGSLCGVISVAVSYPLDMIRVRMAYITPTAGAPAERVRAVVKMIYNEPAYRFGLMNFFRGFPLSLMGIVPYGGVSFLTHEYFTSLARNRYADIATKQSEQHHTKARRRKTRELKAWAELTAGGLSGMFAQTASYPFELVRRRMQIAGVHSPSKKAKASRIIQDVWNKNGLRGFYVGLTIGYVKVAPMFAVSFYTYEKLKAVFDLD